MKLFNNVAPILILFTRLYNTSDRRGMVASSLARIQGVVSSMYLLQRLNRLKISVIASATRSSAILATTLSFASIATLARSSSTGSITPVRLTTPPKYLLLMEMVRFTRFPMVFARSELMRSTRRSQEITPSFSKGISCNTK